MNREIVSEPDYRIQGILTDIEKVKLEEVKDEEFVEQDVYLDGREFQNCAFKYCRIFVKLGRFVIKGPRIQIEHCSFELDYPAGNVRALLDLLAQQK